MSNVKVLTEIATERQLATNIRNSSYSLTTLLEGKIMEHVVTTVKIRGNINRGRHGENNLDCFCHGMKKCQHTH